MLYVEFLLECRVQGRGGVSLYPTRIAVI